MKTSLALTCPLLSQSCGHARAASEPSYAHKNLLKQVASLPATRASYHHAFSLLPFSSGNIIVCCHCNRPHALCGRGGASAPLLSNFRCYIFNNRLFRFVFWVMKLSGPVQFFKISYSVTFGTAAVLWVCVCANVYF